MELLVHGATGRMGQVICQMASEGKENAHVIAAVSPDIPAGGIENGYLHLDDFTGNADCVVDFSHHTATQELLSYCVKRNLPVVIATTGQTAEEKEAIRKAAETIPVFFTANMSLGVAVLAELAVRAASIFPDAEIEIVETHHDQKLDVPSGTALMLGNALCGAHPDSTLLVGRHEAGKRTKREIGIHSLRIGNEVGTHEILISTSAETITLKHQAHSRTLFAEGALRAAAFLCGKPAGLYTMQELLEEN